MHSISSNRARVPPRGVSGHATSSTPRTVSTPKGAPLRNGPNTPGSKAAPAGATANRADGFGQATTPRTKERLGVDLKQPQGRPGKPAGAAPTVGNPGLSGSGQKPNSLPSSLDSAVSGKDGAGSLGSATHATRLDQAIGPKAGDVTGNPTAAAQRALLEQFVAAR